MSKPVKPVYHPTRFMLPTSHYDKRKANRAVSFIQSLNIAVKVALYSSRVPT